MTKRRKAPCIRRYIFNPFNDGDYVYASYRNKMAMFIWNGGRNSTWEKVDNYNACKLMIVMHGNVMEDRLSINEMAARPVLAKILGISLRRRRR